jgi:hypothetical protein
MMMNMKRNMKRIIIAAGSAAVLTLGAGGVLPPEGQARSRGGVVSIYAS